MRTNNPTTIRFLGLGLATLMSATLFAATPSLIRCKVELDRDILPANQRQTAVIKISMEADAPPSDANRSPVNLCIVMDRSGSMGGSKIEQARQAALEALSRLGKNDVFSLVTYDSSVQTLIPAGRITDLRQARRIIEGIQPGGSTALFGGVSQGASELRKFLEDHPEGMVHRMILLSDGLANVGPSSPGELGRLGTSLMKEGISVTTVGLGLGYNEDLMTTLAQTSDGNTYFVENSQDLVRIFSDELGDVLSVVAREIRILIECPRDVKPLRALGRDALIRGQEVELTLNQLYGNQERYLLLEVEVPPTAADRELPLMSAVIHYQNILNQNREEQTLALNARFSEQEAEVKQSANAGVQTDYYNIQSAEAKEQAIQKWEAGDRDGAVEVLEVNRALLKQAGNDYALPEVSKEAENLADQRADLESQGLNSFNRKKMRTEAVQERQQQTNKQSY
ncbi:MAG: VWA domain-containing protein [Kiritimatiellae bacterium]|nr:VWA domain-containing protein [Kiritimatiellia bacterium]